MNKRNAGDWGGDERYGGAPPVDMDGNDKPVQATAAQLARRKLLKPKARTDRGRSDSPAVQPQSGFAANPFAQGFNFTAQQPQQASGSSFTFGQSAPAPQQSGMNPIFSQSSAPAFGGFMTTANQPQQNGFGAPNSLFNQPSQQSKTPSFSFGQTQSQPSQQNGMTTLSASFAGFGNSSQPVNQTGMDTGMGGNGFPGFGQKTQENKSNGSIFGQQAQDSSRASTPGFGNTFATKAPEQAPKSLFGPKPQETGNKGSSVFSGFGQSKAQSKAPENESGFKPFARPNDGSAQMQAENSSKSLFPASQPQVQTPKASSSMFGQPPPAQSAAPSQPQVQTPKASSSMFGQPPPAQSAAPSQGLFGSTSASAPVSGLFGSKIAPNEPTNNGGSIFDHLPKKPSGASNFNFSSADPKQVYNGEDDEPETSSAAAEKASEKQPTNAFPPADFGGFQTMTKPAANIFANSAAPKPQVNLFANSASEQNKSTNAPDAAPSSIGSSAGTATVSSTPAAQPPRSLFDRINEPQTAETPKAPLSTNTPVASSTAKPLFSSGMSATPRPSQFSQPSPAQADDETPRAPAPTNIFAQTASTTPSTPAVAPAAPAVSFKAPSVTTPVPQAFPAIASSTAASLPVATSSTDLNDSQRKMMKALNEGLLAHLHNQQADSDWSATFLYASKTAALILGRPAPSESELSTAPGAQKSSYQTLCKGIPAPAAPSNDSSSSATTASAFASTAQPVQTPNAGSSTSLSSKAPATAPATAPSKKRSFEEDVNHPSREPATEKRSKPNGEPASYPKLPENASNTAKLFASTLDRQAMAKSAEPTASTGFTPSTKSLFSASTSNAEATPASGGFKPSLGNAATPSAGGFKPTLSTAAPGGSFLSSFGALAKKQEEIERQKRKDADYDSDEETEEQWAKRDAAKQEEKRRQAEEAAKSVPSFSIAPATPKPATAATVEKAQGPGDKTWTPKTPLQFGNATATTTPAAAPPMFGNTLSKSFGASAVPDAGSTLAPPSTSSLDASRATTPGATTDGEGSGAANGNQAADNDGEPSDEQNQPQASQEINDLQPTERDANEVLLEVQDVRTSKMEKDEESGKQTWKAKTRGRFFILKDKQTGKVRMLSRTGAGRTVLNHMPNKEATFKVHPKKATVIVASLFVDHMYSTPPGPGQWMFSTPDKDDAEKIARLLTEGTPK